MSIQKDLLGVTTAAARLRKWNKEKSIQEERNRIQSDYAQLLRNAQAEKIKQQAETQAKKDAEDLRYQQEKNNEKLKLQKALDRNKIAQAKEKSAAIKTQSAAMGNGRAMVATDLQTLQKKALQDRFALVYDASGMIKL